jgi:hypothetical protein
MESFLKSNCYPNLNIADSSHMLMHSGRFICEKCKKSRKFFCYSCGEAREKSLVPQVLLPFKVDIIKHKQELVGKSTSSHAKILAPDSVNIYQWPNIPDYSKEEDVILIFVSAKSIGEFLIFILLNVAHFLNSNSCRCQGLISRQKAIQYEKQLWTIQRTANWDTVEEKIGRCNF